MKKIALLFSVSALLFIFSCKNNDTSDKNLITERIQYDVLIKSPDVELDWWVQNIEGAKRESLIKMIMDNVYNGNIKAYDFLDNPLSVEEVKNIGKRNDTLFMPSMEPPYDDSTVVINETLKINDITKLRFLEEWKIDPKTLQIEKRVLGLAPMKQDFDANGELRGFKQLFWIYFDKNYPIKK